VESYADIRHDLVTCLTIFLAAPVTYAEVTHQEKPDWKPTILSGKIQTAQFVSGLTDRKDTLQR